MMKFFTILCLAGICLSAGADGRKNIILIMADDMGYECVGAYGSTYSTPNLDRAAKAGVRFNHCYSTPLCTPSRVEIMTGKYNNRNYKAFGYLDPTQKTIGNLFRDAGYATCIAGKWQLGGGASAIDGFGFDEHCLWNMIEYYDPVQGKKIKGKVEPNKRLRYWEPALFQNGAWRDQKKEEYGADVCAEFMMDFMERNKDKPFLVYYPAILVHSPFPHTPDSPGTDQSEGQNFADMCAYTDKVVGRLEAKLRELGLYEDTVVLFTGDNGTHGRMRTPMQDGTVIKGGKGSMTDGGTHAPLIVWGGGIEAQEPSEALIDFTDMLPTITDLAGVELPAGFETDGQSFKPVLAGEKKDVRDTIYCYYNPRWGKASEKIWARDKEYKLYSDGRFYHVPTDVLEENPIQQVTEKHIATIKKLQDVLDLNVRN
ncbi:Arylsulfatase [Pontiella desulfatans]|uniref:Arylsulfatase n=1 Tax=Pontiella desulfatans TaxID=2750659 RepID=A0A6C2TXL9_PONDE|nr:sulfatase-like hydrolase/transferase [Pontiella desulfatans]SPS73670.1 sulfatase S1_24 [Kiritimatiellales bacterium]VGO12390.1 Arylsulfatase [Pontiella desulfatans]